MLKVSTSADRHSENVRIHAVIVAELELGDVQRQILFADLVESAYHTAFDDRPEAFNGVGVDRADDVMPGAVVDDAMTIFEAKSVVSGVIVRAKQAHSGRDR